jgi:hypothetical protein
LIAEDEPNVLAMATVERLNYTGFPLLSKQYDRDQLPVRLGAVLEDGNGP